VDLQADVLGMESESKMRGPSLPEAPRERGVALGAGADPSPLRSGPGSGSGSGSGSGARARARARAGSQEGSDKSGSRTSAERSGADAFAFAASIEAEVRVMMRGGSSGVAEEGGMEAAAMVPSDVLAGLEAASALGEGEEEDGTDPELSHSSRSSIKVPSWGQRDPTGGAHLDPLDDMD